MSNRPSPRTWRMPLLMALLIVFGLLAALLGTGLWQPLAWIALLIPLLIMARYAFRKS